MTKIAPSIAYVTSSLEPSDHATVVSRPSTGSGSVGPTLVSTNEPVPYVFFVMPGSTHACPNSAACWSPAMPLTGTASPPAQLGSRRCRTGRSTAATSGRHARGTSNSAHSSSDQSQRADVVEHRAARVRRIGRVHAAVGAAGEVPEDPRVDGAEREVGVGRDAAVVQQPRQLRRREVRVEHQPGRAADQRLVARVAQLVAARRGAPVLPHDRAVPRARRCAGPTRRPSRAGW